MTAQVDSHALAAPAALTVVPAADEHPVRKRRALRRAQRLRRALLAADAVAILGAFLVAWASSAIWSGTAAPPLELAAVSIPLWICLAAANGLFGVTTWRADHDAAEEIGAVVLVTLAWSWGLMMLQVAFGRGGDVDVLGLAEVAVLAAGLLLAARAAVRSVARRRIWYWQNAVIVGSPGAATPLIHRVLRHPRFGIHIVACVDPREGGRFVPESSHHIGPVPVVVGIDRVGQIVRTLGVDRVIFAGALNARAEREILDDIADLGPHIDFAPSWSGALGHRIDVHSMAGVPLLTAPAAELSPAAVIAKRTFDLALSSLALVVLSPILLACAIAIRLDSPGPLLFRQRRVGRDETIFEVFKFRSMHVDAEERKVEVAALNFHGGGTDVGMFKIRHDPRITRVGAFLRRASLDELPQLINVVRGDMSLVGPRPLIENEYNQITGRQRRRSSLRPGITGLWQVNGRSEVPFPEMVELDCLYARSWSLAGDLRLLMRTVSVVLRRQGAY